MSHQPWLATLERTPDILTAMLQGATDQAMAWKPKADRWSISEVLAHLAHVEVEGFRNRVKQFLEGEKQRLGTYDQNAYAGAGVYSGKDGRASLEQFRRERAASLDYLGTVPRDAASKTALHPELGEVALSNLLHEWAFHDLGHIRQIAELYRSCVYWPEMGGWRNYYKINP